MEMSDWPTYVKIRLGLGLGIAVITLVVVLIAVSGSSNSATKIENQANHQIQQAEKQSQQIEKQAAQASSGNTGAVKSVQKTVNAAESKAAKLASCITNAGTDTTKIAACTAKFGA
jgi:hypothetical protein